MSAELKQCRKRKEQHMKLLILLTILFFSGCCNEQEKPNTQKSFYVKSFFGQFINKKIIRTQGVWSGQVEDYSYTTDPVVVLRVTENHVIVKSTYKKEMILSPKYYNKNWVLYPLLKKERK